MTELTHGCTFLLDFPGPQDMRAILCAMVLNDKTGLRANTSLVAWQYYERLGNSAKPEPDVDLSSTTGCCMEHAND